MRTLEELDAEYQKKRAELFREQEIMAALPAGLPAPAFVHFVGDRFPWVSYKAETLADALAILRGFHAVSPFLTVSAIRSGCLSVEPEGFHGKQYETGETEFIADDCIGLEQQGGKGFYSATLTFWTPKPLLKINVKIADFPWAWRISNAARYDRYGYCTSATLNEPAEIRSRADNRIRFGGGSLDAFDIRYFWHGLAAFESVAESALPDQVTP